MHNFRIADFSVALAEKAERVFVSNFSDPQSVVRLEYSRNKVLESPEVYYFPFGFIGCAGFLVEKSSLRLISFGSYINAESHIWAYYKGISMAPTKGERKNTLKICTVSNTSETLRVLKQFISAKYVLKEISPKLQSLPIVLENVDLYFGIRGLIEAESKGWFGYEIT